jgi:SWIM zinc finger
MVVSYGKNGTREFGVCIRGRQVFYSCSDFRERGLYCKHIAAVALHELVR